MTSNKSLTLEKTTAAFYWVDPVVYELRKVSASSTSEDCRSLQLCAELPMEVQRWLEESTEEDSRCFTDVEGVGTLVAVRLHPEGTPAGVLTLRWREAEMDVAVGMGRALVEAMRELELLRDRLRSARQENVQLERRLAERKLVERAKGRLQVHYGWTEEDAYYHLRRTSRQERAPMAVIAQRIIDLTAAKEAERISA